MTSSHRATRLAALVFVGLLAACDTGGGSRSAGGGKVHLRVDRVSPSIGPTSGGTRVLVEGTGFEDGAGVRFGGLAASGVVVAADGASLECLTPPSPPDLVDVTVTLPGGSSATLEDGYAYLTVRFCPTVDALDTDEFPETGGVVVRVAGFDFAPGTDVFFGPVLSPRVTFISPSELLAVTPAVPPGLMDVTVQNPGGCADTLIESIEALWSVTKDCSPLIGVSPRAVSAAGGDEVVLTQLSIPDVVSQGRVFIDGVEVPASGGTKETRFTMPPHAPGAVEIVVAAGSEAVVISGGLQVIDPLATGPVVSGVLPPSAPRDSGITITLTGERFSDTPPPEVWVGGRQAADVVVLDPSSLQATLPMSPCPGRADIRVRDPSTGAEWSVALAFEYERVPGDMEILSLPPPAPCSGGVWGSVQGKDIPPDVEVWIGGTRATSNWVAPDRVDVLIPPLGFQSWVDVRFVAPTTGCEELLRCAYGCY